MKKLLAMAALSSFAAPLLAASQTVTLSVPDMHCAACPITVKKALTKLPGVGRIDVNLERREAKVTFDDVKTSADVLTRATKDAGYPSSVVGTAK